METDFLEKKILSQLIDQIDNICSFVIQNTGVSLKKLKCSRSGIK